MTAHRVVLLAPDLASLVAPAGAVPSIDSDWPGPEELRGIVGAPHAQAIRSPHRDADATITHLLWDADAESRGPWLPLAELEPAMRDLLQAAAAAYRDGVDDDRQEWYRRGWLAEVEAWADAALAASGRTRSAASEIVKLWGLSALLRLPTRDAHGGEASVWFKAACDGFHAEPALTEAAASLAPAFLPHVIATDERRAWMLLEEFVVESEQASAEVAAAAATQVARLQLASVARTDLLAAAGAPDRGPAATRRDFADLLATGLELDLMAPDRLVAAREALPWLAECSMRLEELGLPTTLVHGDLHTGNIAGTAEGPVVFDWTDTCLAHPYVDGVHLVQSVAATDAAASIVVKNTYLAPWRAAHPDVDHDRAWALAEIEEGMFTAVSYERIARAQPAESRWELEGIAARLIGRLVDVAARERGVGGPL